MREGIIEKRSNTRIYEFGERSTIRTAIRGKPLKLAQYLRGEKR